MNNDVLFFSGNLQRFFSRSSEARHYGEALHRVAASGAGCCSFAFVQLPVCWCSSPTALMGGRRLRIPQLQMIVLLVPPICNCMDSPSGPTGGCCTPGPAPVVHRYPWRYNSYLDIFLRKTQKHR